MDCSPQWFSMNEYTKIIPTEQIDAINNSEKQLNRYVLPYSFNIARYENGNSSVDAIIYQYAFVTNPRNIAFGLKLFKDNTMLEGNGGIGSMGEAKMMCDRRAAEHLK